MNCWKKFVIIANLFVVLFLINQVMAVDDSNLVMHIKFDEGAGSKAYDSAGNNDGTIYGAQWVNGIMGGALYFDGVNDYVNCGNDSSLDIRDNLTISLWFNCTAWTTRTGNVYINGLISKRDLHVPGQTDFDWSISYNNYLDDIQLWDSYVSSFHTLHVKPSTNEWHHLVVTKIGTTAALYLDGVLKGTDATNALWNTGDSVRIGINAIDWPPDKGFFYGTIDDVRIYDKALTSEGVEQLYLQAFPLTVAVDIKPTSCPNPLNLKSRGVLPVAILGSAEFDVNSVDIASIRLAGVAPIRSSVEDVAAPVNDTNECACTDAGPDGFADLALKFKTTEIVQNILTAIGEPNKGDVISLALEGLLLSDRPITGSDCVVLVGKVPSELLAVSADINKDGKVDFDDLAVFSEYWLEEAYID